MKYFFSRKDAKHARVFSLRTLRLCVIIIFFSCNSEYTPRPKGYPRVVFPNKEYQSFSSEFCPFTFDYPKYAEISRDTIFLDTIPDNPCWLNINFPDFAGTIYLSYKPIDKKNSLEQLVEDAHKMTFKHTVKAESIEAQNINTPNNVYGLFYDVGGNAASSVQFFVTDSTQHCLRGALYFNTQTNADSLAPVIDFVKKDVVNLINTLKWKN